MFPCHATWSQFRPVMFNKPNDRGPGQTPETLADGNPQGQGHNYAAESNVIIFYTTSKVTILWLD